MRLILLLTLMVLAIIMVQARTVVIEEYDDAFIQQDPTAPIPPTDPVVPAPPAPTPPPPEVIPVNPADPIPTDGIILRKPIIFPAPATPAVEDGVSFGPTPPANLTKPVIVDGTIPLPPAPTTPCGCANVTKPLEYRNDVKYRIKRSVPVLPPCPCNPNATAPVAQPVLPPIIARLKPAPKNITISCNTTTVPIVKRAKRLAPQYKRRTPKILAPLPACNTTNTTKAPEFIKPKFKRLSKEQLALTNVSYASF
jgi:hypothetical protein